MDEPSIVLVAWGKTVNIGNYESIKLELTAQVNEGQKWREVLVALKLLVREQENKVKPPPKV